MLWFLLVFLVLISFSPMLIKKLRIWHWKQKHGLIAKQNQFNQIFANTNGFLISKQARMQKDQISLCYGEINFLSFIALLSNTSINQSSVFIDLGSGIGKAVVACALCFKPKKCIGIEILKPLHEAANQVTEELDANIELINDNFHHQNISLATHIYFSSVGFVGNEWSLFENKLLECKPGTEIITLSKPLNSDSYKLLAATDIEMSWGFIKAYIHKKLN
jgi:hypothetical protein